MPMNNDCLVTQSLALADQIDAVIDATSRAGDGTLTTLREARDDIRAIAGRLEALSQFVSLRPPSPSGQFAAVASMWAALDAGTHRFGEPEFERVLTASTTLRTLESAAVSVRSMRKYEDWELAGAALIGACFVNEPNLLQNFRIAVVQGRRLMDRHVYRQQLSPLAEVLRTWQAAGLLQGVDAVAYECSHGNGEWQPLTKSQRKKLGHRDRVRFKNVGVTPRGKQLLSGDWLPAYVASVIRDQAARSSHPASVFAEVQFELPDDIARGSGDIDVLVSDEHGVLFVECKSGVLRSHSALAKLEGNRERFRHVLQASGLNPEFLLVYNHAPKCNAEVPAWAESMGVTALRVDEVRPFIQRRAAVGTA